MTGQEIGTLVDALRRQVDARPEQPALTFVVEGGTETDALNYAQLDRTARSIAVNLQQRLSPGDRALLLYPPGLEFVSAFFGCLYAGVIAVPAYPPTRRTADRLVAVARDSEPSIVLTLSSIEPLLRAGMDSMEAAPALPMEGTDLFPDASDGWRARPIGGEAIAFLQYTSGSTSDPKGVMVTHGNLVANQRMMMELAGHDEGMVAVTWLPVYHDMGLIGAVLSPLCIGGRAYVMSPLEFLKRPVTWLQAMTRFRGTAGGGPDFAFERCVRKVTAAERRELDLSSWTAAYNGAEPVRPDTVERFSRAFAECGFRPEAMSPGYGLAESTLLVTGGSRLAGASIRSFDVDALESGRRAVERGGDGTRRLVGAGRPSPEGTLLIVDPESRIPLAPGGVGEIWYSGPNVAAGYWGRPEETRAMFQGFLAGTEEGPFLRTGDLGFVVDGELFVAGRIKDLVIIRGRNHYPQDIERTVERSHPSLRPGCGVAIGTDAEGEERLLVIQEVEEGTDPGGLDSIVAAIRGAVAAEHDLRAQLVVLIPKGEVSKTSSGKIQRRRTRDRYLAGELPVLAESFR